ncbi:MAG: hypothetical protein L3J14_07470 [Flavobacteriaceae bacterium]|nr:hypothetical protein [Flavobacteriaceae bacterium]
MNAHTNYKVYPKAINEFINDNYDLNNINFGNIKNNVIAILQKLKIDDTLDCDWDISHLYFFDKVNISKNNNKPSDFDEYSNFNFIFKSKKGKSTKEFETAIQKLESNFIFKYQNRLDLEHQKIKEQLLVKEKRTEKIIYALVIIGILLLISAVYFLKRQT